MGGTRFRALRARGAREAKSAYHMFMWGPRQFQRDITHPRTPTYDQKTPAVLLPSYIKSNSKISLSFTQTFARDIKIPTSFITVTNYLFSWH